MLVNQYDVNIRTLVSGYFTPLGRQKKWTAKLSSVQTEPELSPLSNKSFLYTCVKCLIKAQRPRKCRKRSLSLLDGSYQIHAVCVRLRSSSLNY